MKKTLSRRGATLTELVIVMALVAIVSLIIISFSSMAYSFADRNEEEYLFLEDCAIAEETLRRFFSQMDVEDNAYTLKYENDAPQEGPKTRFGFRYSLNGEKYTYAEMDDGKLCVDAMTLPLSTITAVCFEEYKENLTNANALVRCTLKGEGIREHSFLLVLRAATPEPILPEGAEVQP